MEKQKKIDRGSVSVRNNQRSKTNKRLFRAREKKPTQKIEEDKGTLKRKLLGRNHAKACLWIVSLLFCVYLEDLGPEMLSSALKHRIRTTAHSVVITWSVSRGSSVVEPTLVEFNHCRALTSLLLMFSHNGIA